MFARPRHCLPTLPRFCARRIIGFLICNSKCRVGPMIAGQLGNLDRAVVDIVLLVVRKIPVALATGAYLSDSPR